MTEKKVGIISQARMTSTRLPGKVLKTAANIPFLKYHTDKLRQSGSPIFIATTTHATDDPIASFGEKEKIPVYRGDEQNVLSRYYGCALKHHLDIIVRVTSDCPFIDGKLIGASIRDYQQRADDLLYLSNCLVRTYPRGLDFEVFSMKLLTEAFQNATLPADLEHVTPYINQNRSGQVHLAHVTQPQDRHNYRLTLDTEPDYQLLKLLIEKYQAHHLSTADLIKLLDEHPELVAINADVLQKNF